MTPSTITITQVRSLAEHPIDGPYVRDVWAAVVGATGTLLLERCGQLLAVHGDPAVVELEHLAAWMGQMPSKLTHALARLDKFRLVSWDGSTLRIRSHVPSLTPAQLQRCGPIVGRIHGALTAVVA